ncbi:MAG: WbqC family protein [Aureispira sp.]|nr:WbqC family protein [Aureispira sp.]
MNPQHILIELQYLGTIQYYSKLIHYPKVYLEQHENYRKGSFRNRCHISTANGVLGLSIPLLKGKNQQMNIQTVQIDNRLAWQVQHWRSIRTAYGNSPFFEFYEQDLYSLYAKKYDLLFNFCFDLQKLIIQLLSLSPNIELTAEFWHNPPDNILDFRHKIRPSSYQDGLDPHFEAATYPQVFEDRHGFVPNLSILDLLFCAGPESYNYLLASFKN